MTNKNDDIKIGWNEFIKGKRDMLATFAEQKAISEKRPTQTDKGKVAESAFRRWLENFLPKKFGVTSGYIISQGEGLGNKLLHFDVIIYDAINSPILWVEDDADKSPQGKIRAIPAEHVLSVLEIKSTFNKVNSKHAKEKLWQLKPLLEDIDDPDEVYKQFLPPNFSMGVVFYEVLEKDKSERRALDELVPLLGTKDLRGYFGGVVLMAEGQDINSTGLISFNMSTEIITELKGNLMKVADSKCFKTGEKEYYTSLIMWASPFFSIFAFNLVALLNGTYKNGFASSFHGLPFSVTKKIK